MSAPSDRSTAGGALDATFVAQTGEFVVEASVRADPGTVLALLGPNGSGKTTILRAIAGLLPITDGSVRIGDRVVDDPRDGLFVPPHARPVGVVFQEYLLFDHLRTVDNVAFGLRARGMPAGTARARARELLGRFGLDDQRDAYPSALSGGQAQRVALARALAIDPAVLLLDEPLAALDVATRRHVRRELRQQLAVYDGVRILVTHDPVDAYALADRVAVLDEGRIVQEGTIADIVAHPRSQYVADLVGTNLVAGTVGPDGLVTAGGTAISVVADATGPAFALVRPSSITLSRSAPKSSARNTFPCTVDDIDRLGDRVRVGVAGPLHLTAEITPAALDGLDLAVGTQVWASVKATDIAVYPA